MKTARTKTTKHSMKSPLFMGFICLFSCLALHAPAQTLLKLDRAKRCIFYPQGQEEELYAFPVESPEVQQLVAEILLRGGELEQNFSLVQANVENVSAVLDGEERYILWNQDFWENATPLMRLASFAHEIGHHANEHRFTAQNRELEEREADVFTGFVLFMKNAKPRNISLELDPNMWASAGNDGIGIKDMLQGYANAAKTLELAALSFENDPSWDAFLQAEFPFPPPQCYQTAEISAGSLSEAKTLGDVGKKISQAFGQLGYPYRFMSVPDGFAVVTQLEQYQEDGSMYPQSLTRWQELPQAESFSLSLSYLKSLVFPRKAHLRVFAVLVTQRSYPSNQAKISKEEAKAWISRGVNRLPKSLAAKPFTSAYAVDMLVYEFEVPETTFIPWQHCPCHLSAREHLRKTGLDAWLR
jgi:hypothetical protein